MKKQDKNIAMFVSFCIEEYAAEKSLTGEECFALFEQCGVIQYLIEYYDCLSSEDIEWIIEEIDDYISHNTKRK